GVLAAPSSAPGCAVAPPRWLSLLGGAARRRAVGMRALLPSLLCGLLIAGCVPKPEKNYTPDEIPQITSIEEVMRVQAARMDPLVGIRDQASFTDEEFARMAKAAAVLEATSAHLAESFAGKGEYDAGFAELANQLGA